MGLGGKLLPEDEKRFRSRNPVENARRHSELRAQ